MFGAQEFFSQSLQNSPCEANKDSNQLNTKCEANKHPNQLNTKCENKTTKLNLGFEEVGGAAEPPVAKTAVTLLSLLQLKQSWSS